MWIVRYQCGCSNEAKRKCDLLEYCGKHGSNAREWINTSRSPAQALPADQEQLPSDFEITSLVHKMWRSSLNLEHGNIAACMASQMRVKGTDRFREYVHTRLKALVRKGDLRHQRFLPGRPFYTVG